MALSEGRCACIRSRICLSEGVCPYLYPLENNPGLFFNLIFQPGVVFSALHFNPEKQPGVVFQQVYALCMYCAYLGTYTYAHTSSKRGCVYINGDDVLDLSLSVLYCIVHVHIDPFPPPPSSTCTHISPHTSSHIPHTLFHTLFTTAAS